MVKADTEFLMYLSPAIPHTIFISFILSQSYGLIELDASSTLNLAGGGGEGKGGGGIITSFSICT